MKLNEIVLAGADLNPATDWDSLRMPDAFEKGLVSVIVPTYNRATFLAEAIDSVLNQTYRPIELLIVDDGSKDNTAEVVREKFTTVPDQAGFTAIYIRQPNRGASAARNQGLLKSRGEFIQYLDSDDVLVRHKIANHVAAMTDESLDVVWSNWLVLPSEQVDQRFRELNDQSSAGGEQFGKTDGMIPWEPWPTLTRRRFVAAHPLWNEHVSRWDDWEYGLRQLAANPRRAKVPGIGCIQREHQMGRRFDFDADPAGVEVGLTACRQAKKARPLNGDRLTQLDQLVANRYWEVGLEALIRGTAAQAKEAFGEAAGMGNRWPFVMKAWASKLALQMTGRRMTRRLLSRYCR